MYIPKQITNTPDYQKCIEFHGHTCMGVTIGYLAAKLGLKLLEEVRANDEEIITVVETDACPCDAIQVLTGCTFGKGNFFYVDHGKMAFTFASRDSGIGVRLVLKPGITSVPEKERQLAEKLQSHSFTPEDAKRYEEMYELRGEQAFARGAEAFFDIEMIQDFALPPKAPMAPSQLCDICGEMVMETKLEQIGENSVCRGCLD